MNRHLLNSFIQLGFKCEAPKDQKILKKDWM